MQHPVAIHNAWQVYMVGMLSCTYVCCQNKHVVEWHHNNWVMSQCLCCMACKSATSLPTSLLHIVTNSSQIDR